MNLIGKKVKWLKDDPINGVSKDSIGEVVDSEYDDSSDILRLAVKTSDEPYKYWYKIGSPYIQILEGVKMKKTIVESAQRYLEEDEIPQRPQSGVKLFVSHMAKEITEDNYEQGEIGERQLQMDEKIGKTFDSFDDFKKWLEKEYALNCSDNDSWAVINNRLIFQQSEDQDGMTIEQGDRRFEQFKKGEINLWTADYDFVVELIVPSKTDEEDVRAFTGIQN
jgi:hypothetical protein